jgi:hypothetical protein
VSVIDAVGAPADWYDDPRRVHRLRYWDGARWTRWVAEEGPAFEEQSSESDEILSGPLEAPEARRVRRFPAELLLAGGPIFVIVFGWLGVFALTHGGTQAGIFFVISSLAIAVLGLRTPYVAIVRPDGSLTFRAVTHSITTTTASIRCITIQGGRAAHCVFHFDGRAAGLGDFGGSNLARYLLERDPTIEAPRRLRPRGA